MGASLRVFALSALVGVLLAGCGGSSTSSAQQSKLLSRINTQLQSSDFKDPDLASCIIDRLRGQPTSVLQKVASAGTNADPATRHLVYGDAASCVAQGHGAPALHQAIVQGVNNNTSSTTPPAMTQCILAKAQAIPNSQLAALITTAENGQSAEQARAQQMGIGLAHQCLNDPTVMTLLRQRFLTPIRSGLTSSHFSVAFRNCVLGKAQGMPSSQLRQMALNPAGASAQGQALGRQWAQQCIASGVKP